MPRRPRVDYPGAIHHLFNRGANKQPIFLDSGARDFFLRLLGEVAREYGLEVHAYALMGNHYHLLVRSTRGLLSEAMRSLVGRYTRAVNQRFDRDGPLFRGRFRSRVVLDVAYLIHLVAYIHGNPARAGVQTGDRWTSRLGMLGRTTHPTVDVEPCRALFGSPDDYLRYEAGVIDGSVRGPDGFEGDLGAGPEIAIHGPWTELRRPSMKEAIRQVGEVTGRPLLLVDGRGAHREPEKRLLVWWLNRGSGLAQTEIALWLGISQSRVSQIVRQVERELLNGGFARESARLWEWFDRQVERFNVPRSA